MDEVLQLNLTTEARSTLNGVKSYLNSFRCIVMASVWVKVLTAIDQRNKILQIKDQTLDVEVANIKSLLDELESLKGKWVNILSECQTEAVNLNIETSFPVSRSRKRKDFLS